MKIELWDSFNNTLISRHFNLYCAVKSQRAHAKRLRKNNSFVTYSYQYKNGVKVNDDLILETKCRMDRYN